MKIGDGATPTETFTTIAEVMDIVGPSMSLGTHDVTNHSSSGAWKEVIPGLLEPGEVTFPIAFLPTTPTHSQSTGLLRDMKNRTKRNFQIVFTDAGATAWTIAAYVTGFEPTMPVDGLLGADVTLKVTGQPTLAG
jgi:hypothetical protein